MLLTREAILAAGATLPRETVAVPEWGGEVIVATMTGAARDEWEQSIVTNGRKVENVRAKLVAATVIDEEGRRLFSADDVQALGRLSSAALDRVCKVAQRLNGLTAEELESAKGN